MLSMQAEMEAETEAQAEQHQKMMDPQPHQHLPWKVTQKRQHLVVVDWISVVALQRSGKKIKQMMTVK